MQKDMHFHGTYCMARAAGLAAAAAQVAASAAQYVDDNVSGDPIVLRDGARLLREATAHHLADPRNVSPDDQRRVWVPFHFLPGLESDGDDADYSALLKCRKDSEVAREMVRCVLAAAEGNPFALERIGITAHVYADTFSHYGFSGIGSRRNQVDGTKFVFDHDDETVSEIGERYFAEFGAQGGAAINIKSWREALTGRVAAMKSAVAETLSGALGHGAVATYPDQPYLVWSYEAEYPRRRRIDRNNPADFLEACQALHAMFAAFAASRPDFADRPARPFGQMQGSIEAILANSGRADERAEAWAAAARSGRLFGAAEDIPPYLGDEWTAWLAEADGKIDSTQAMDHPACRFHIAAGSHRTLVLHELLPARNLLVA